MKLLFANDAKGQHAPSLYAATSDTPPYPALTNDITVDVCIVGAGYTGLSTALHCAQQGLSVAVLDAHRVGWGASGRNGGQLGTGFNMAQSELEKRLGQKRAQALWTLSENAKTTIHQLCAEHNFDIEYRAGIISAYHRARYVNAAHQYCDTLAKQYQYEQFEPLSKEQLSQRLDSPAYFGGVLDHGAGHIHPLKLAYGLAKAATTQGAAIYEQSLVLSIESNSSTDSGSSKGSSSGSSGSIRSSGNSDSSLVHTESGTVQAQHVVLACNGYLGDFNTHVQQRVMPINNFIVATEPLGDGATALLPERNAVFDSRFVVNYFRITNDNRLLFGGGETYGYKFPADIRRVVSKPLLEVFPQLNGINFEYAWGGTLAITRSRLPYVCKLDNTTYSASGYSGHGVALAVESGKAIAAAIGGDTASLNVLQDLPCARFPGGGAVRSALLAGAMTWYSILDRF